MENIISITFLAVGTVWDIKRKTIPLKFLLVWGSTNLIYLSVISLSSVTGEYFIQAFWGVMPGVICLFLAHITREQIGYGDGWIIVLMGILLGIKNVLVITIVALTILTCLSFVLLITRKVGRKTAIPFIPFLLLGNVSTLFLGGILG